MSLPPSPDRLRVRDLALDAAVRLVPWRGEDGADVAAVLALAEQLEAWLTRPEAPDTSVPGQPVKTFAEVHGEYYREGSPC